MIQESRAPSILQTQTTRTPLAQRARRVRDSHCGPPSRSQYTEPTQRDDLPTLSKHPTEPQSRGTCSSASGSALTLSLVDLCSKRAAGSCRSTRTEHTVRMVREGSGKGRVMHAVTFLSGLDPTIFTANGPKDRCTARPGLAHHSIHGKRLRFCTGPQFVCCLQALRNEARA